jgi:hypothetical protein
MAYKIIPKEVRQRILREVSDNIKKPQEIADEYGVSLSLVCKLKSQDIKDEVKIKRIIKKGTTYKVKVTTYLKGSIKNKFIKDCLDKKFSESQMGNHVFDTYYYLQESIHNFEKIEPNKIKDYLKARIKL